MQDPDAPPAVVEGETDGGVVVVPEAAAATQLGAINNRAAFIARPWITVTALPWPAATTVLAPDASAPALPMPIPSPNPSLCPCAKTLPHESSPSWTIFSSRPRFRKPPAS